MSTTQPGALALMASDMTFAPDSPMPFPCKLTSKKQRLAFLITINSAPWGINTHTKLNLNQLNVQRLWADSVYERDSLDVCHLVVSLQGCGDEYGSIHTQRVLLQTEDAHRLFPLISTHVSRQLSLSNAWCWIWFNVSSSSISMFSIRAYFSDLRLLLLFSAFARAFAPSIPTVFPRKLKHSIKNKNSSCFP